jgi:hypothetical protein
MEWLDKFLSKVMKPWIVLLLRRSSLGTQACYASTTCLAQFPSIKQKSHISFSRNRQQCPEDEIEEYLAKQKHEDKSSLK